MCTFLKIMSKLGYKPCKIIDNNLHMVNKEGKCMVFKNPYQVITTYTVN